MISRKKLTGLCGILIGLNLCFIWGNSLLPAALSGGLSTALKEWIHTLFPGAGLVSPTESDHILRKLMHFTEFAALGFLLTGEFRLLGKKRPYIWGFGFGVAAAAIDECIQIFVPGRGPAVKDVGIDSTGVLLGTVLMLFVCYLYKKIKRSC